MTPRFTLCLLSIMLFFPATTVFASDHTKGETIHKSFCASCHTTGIAGAPVTGDADAWRGRLQQGKENLVKHAIEGYHGAMGYMPPKGGNSALTDEEVDAAVEFMINRSR